MVIVSLFVGREGAHGFRRWEGRWCQGAAALDKYTGKNKRQKVAILEE